MKKKYWMRWLDSFSDNRKSKIQNLKWAGFTAILLLLVGCVETADAQQPKKVARICSLENTASGSTAIYLKMFRERLREIGYIEGQNITFEPRYWEGKVERLPQVVAELVRLNCDAILTVGTEAVRAVKNATKTIPVIMAFGADAVRRGIVADLAHPGGNITGLTSIGTEIYGKRLELLKETVPKLSRVGFIWSPTSPDGDHALKDTEPVARYLGVEIQSLEVKGPDDFGGGRFKRQPKSVLRRLWC